MYPGLEILAYNYMHSKTLHISVGVICILSVSFSPVCLRQGTES